MSALRGVGGVNGGGGGNPSAGGNSSILATPTAISASATLLEADSGASYLSDSSIADVVLALPEEPADGTNFTVTQHFSVNTTHIFCAGTDTLISETGTWIELDAAGDSVTLRYHAGIWWLL